jgi:hypothetical protein
MPIPVICPKCHKSFRVSDKFAGKSGPCPACKTVIKVPEAAAVEVTVHTPEEFGAGGRTTTGKLALKPIARVQAKLDPLMATIVAAAAVVIVLAAWGGGQAHLFDGSTWKGYFGGAIGLLLVSPLLVVAAYTFLRDDELEPYRGTALYIRSGACAVGYVLLWAMFNYVIGSGLVSTGDVWSWLLIAPPFLLVGALAALAALDLDYGSAFFHYSFYLFVTILLRWIAGAGWVWNIPQPPTM